MPSLTVVKRPPPRKPNAPRGGQLTPEVIMTDRNDRIREIAYFLWLEEGCPEGEAQRHWLAAEAIVEAELREGKRVDEGEPPGEPVGDSSTSVAARGRSSQSFSVFTSKAAFWRDLLFPINSVRPAQPPLRVRALSL